MNRVVTILLFALATHLCFAQDYQSRSQQMLSRYQQESQKAVLSYREHCNATYEKYLRKSWEALNGMPAISKPEEKELPPVVLPKGTPAPVPKDNPLPFEESIPVPVPAPSPAPIFPIKETPTPSPDTLRFLFFGTECALRIPRQADRMKGSDEGAVANLWKALSTDKYNNMLVDCLSLRSTLTLCDWAYVLFVEKAAAVIYGSVNTPEAIVLQTFILVQSGFRAFFARDEKGGLHRLLAIDRDLYGYPYWNIQGNHCYLMDGCKEKTLRVMSFAFEGTVPMSMAMNVQPTLSRNNSGDRVLQSKTDSGLKVTVHVNKNLIAFYDTYPESVQSGDFTTRWRFYANTPISPEVRASMYPALRTAIDGIQAWEAVNMLLNFVQTSLEYGYDTEIWGRDRPFFADESLYYPFCDCEDRSILFSRLVRDLVGLDVVLIYYPNHLAAAVYFPGGATGDYVILGEKKYVICDPTILSGAPVGVTMRSMDNSKAIVIPL